MPNTILDPRTEGTPCDFRSDDLAKEMLANIIGEKNFDIDDIEWDDSKVTVPEDLMSKWKTDVDPVTIEELTSRQAFGSGIFDALMQSVHNHLKIEYDKNRITGAEYATTYTKLTEAAMANAVQFCLQKNQAYFQGILAQAQAISAGIQAQIAAISAKVQLAKVKAEALGVAAQYALTAMKLSTEDAQHALTCKQQAVADAQISLTEAQALLATYQAKLMNPSPTGADVGKNIDYLIKQQQLESAENQARLSGYQADAQNPALPANNNANIDFKLKLAQKDQIDKNIQHIAKQMEVEGAQKLLYDQQKISFQRKSEKDVADLFSNAYIAMKSVDEGLAIPKALSGASINEVLQTLKENADLGDDSTNKSTSWLQDGVLRGTASTSNQDDNS